MYTYTAHEAIGYFQRDAKVTVSKPLERMPYAQAGVACRTVTNTVFEPVDLKILYSYTTEVIRMYDNRFVLCTGTYSQTTRRHISAFVREYLPEGCSYYNMKSLAKTGGVLDLLTGELLTDEAVKSRLRFDPDYCL